MNMLEGMPQRQAALLLHALSQSDQAWILAALPEQDSSELTTLLQELRDMNVTPDPSWVVQWLPQTSLKQETLPEVKRGQAHAVGSTSLASKSHAELMELKPHQVSELARLLSGEPVHLTMCLLRIQPWPWREKLLSQMSASAQMRLRQSLRDLTADSGLGPDRSETGLPGGSAVSRVEQALVDALVRRLAKSTTAAVADVGAAKDSNQFLPRPLIALWRSVWITPARTPS